MEKSGWQSVISTEKGRVGDTNTVSLRILASMSPLYHSGIYY